MTDEQEEEIEGESPEEIKEEVKVKATKPVEKTTPKKSEGVANDTPSSLKRAEEVVKQQAENNKKREELIEREENILANKTLEGQGMGGSQIGKPKEETEDEKWANEAKKRYAGTGMDPTSDETPTVLT